MNYIKKIKIPVILFIFVTVIVLLSSSDDVIKNTPITELIEVSSPFENQEYTATVQSIEQPLNEISKIQITKTVIDYNCTTLSSEKINEIQEIVGKVLNNKDAANARIIPAIQDYSGEIFKESIVTTDKIDSEKNYVLEFLKLMEKFPDNKLINYYFLNACAQDNNNPSCTKININRAVDNDRSNGTVLGLLANIYISQGNVQTAIEVLDEASSSPIFEDYRSQTLRLFIDTLNQTEIPKSQKIIATVIFYGALPSMGINEIEQLCDQNDEEFRSDIMQSCINYGKHLEMTGETVIANSIGLRILRKLYKLTDDEINLELTIDKIKANKERFNEPNYFNDIFTHDESFQDYWLLTLINHSEQDAIELLKEEVNRISSDEDYTPCPTI